MMHNNTSQPMPICHVNPQEGISVVGIIQALSDNQKLALLATQSKANDWEGALCKYFLPRHLAWVALCCVIWPSLWYPLAVTSFSKVQALLITSHLYHTLLP